MCNFNPKFVAEAAERGLELIGDGKNRICRKYRFIGCGHEQEIGVGDVRKNSFKCKTCQTEKLEAEATVVGLEIIGAGKNRNYRNYRFNECGHTQEIAVCMVRSNTFRCNTCFPKKDINQEALNAGLEIIGEGRSSDCRKYRFIGCGHEQDIIVSCVRSNEFKCNTCFPKKDINQEALNAGLEIIGEGKNATYRNYRLQCGHTQEIAVHNVRDNKFCCRQCEESHWTKESGLYALIISDDDNQWIKVGVSRDINRRIKEYNLSKTAIVDIKYFIKTKDMFTATKVEKFIQCGKLKQYQLPPEEMKQYMQQGFTECFSIEAWDLVEVMFNKIKAKFTS